MADDPKFLISMGLARLTLLTQLMRILLRERAHMAGQTGEDILKWSEDIKQFFEGQNPSGQADAFLTAACDEFFNQLATEVDRDKKG